MSITVLTVLEIYTQPADLEASIGERGGKFGIVLTRGPEHNFKMLLTSEPIFENREDAADALVSTLRAYCKHAAEVLTDPTSVFARVHNPEGEAIEQDRVLNDARLDEILTELRLHGVASTYKMFVPAA